MAQSTDVHDLIIIGAGVYGICAANTYLALYPIANIKVLDADSDVGGTWSSSRSYPRFWSQSGSRISGFPDAPFTLPQDAPTYHDLFEAKYLTSYLQSYVTKNRHDGRSLRERFVFSSLVTNVIKSRDDGTWSVHTTNGANNSVLRTKKIIVATGLTSLAQMPNLPGKESFHGQVLHQKDFGRSSILTDDEPDKERNTHITVLGGGKSAADMVYAAATDSHAPRKVSWIIRRNGSGPPLLAAVKAFGKFRNLTETASTRAIAYLSTADPYVPEGWWNWFLHKTPVGEWLLQRLWEKTEADSAKLANYYGREDALKSFDGMKSESRIRWRSGPIGLLQSDDFWDVVARKAQVYRRDVMKLRGDAIILEDGAEVKTDVLVCATGWAPGHPYFTPEETARLGLPIAFVHDELVKEERLCWSKREAQAEAQVLQRWPYLAHAPRFDGVQCQKTPYRLCNLIVPPEDQSIAFLGQCLVPNSYHTSVAQALYAIAALHGLLELPSREAMDENVAYISRWSAMRYPFHGQLGNVVEFEMVSYTDHLLAQLGLSSHRRLDSWWCDLADPCLASDYAGLTDEFRRKYGLQKAGG